MTRFWELRSWAIAGFLALSVLRCGSNVEPTTATDIARASGDGQIGTVGLALASPLVALVTDANNNPVPGVTVTWQAEVGGSVSPQTAKTGSDGRALVSRTLGPTPGEQTTTATVSGLTPITFSSTAVEGNPDGGIAITTTPPVAALTREVFDPSVQPVVRVTLAGGAPAVGQGVTASIASGGGSLEGKTTATTDANGIARFTDLGINGTGDNTIAFTAGTASVTASVSVSALSVGASKGEWGPVVPWDIVPLHMSLLPSGKIFAWGKRDVADSMGMPRIWDPSTGSPPKGLPAIQVTDMLFCAGQTLMPDGSLMVAGGHHQDDAGIKTTYFFSQDGVPQKGPDMAFGRWYPTLTVLGDGRVVTMAGKDAAHMVVKTPEIWEGGGWVPLPGAANLELPYYPRNFVAPDGRLFYAGERIESQWLEVDASSATGRGRWTPGPRHIEQFNRDYGSAVMYDDGKILYVGGGGDLGWGTPDTKVGAPTPTAEKIDLNGSATWQRAGSMSTGRRHLNATVLPDGQVLVTGGLSGGGFNNLATAVKAAEIWNPESNGWTTLASGSIARGYHTVSLLMPDGKVLHGASGDANIPGSGGVPYDPQRNHQIFSPPYLFKGVRPTIASAPTDVAYNQAFSVTTPNAAQITEVRWIHLGTVTHAFDAGQRANKLNFTVNEGNVEVTAPAGPSLAPPGHYLLFILNRNGVPSVGKIIRVHQ
jgi:Domain of unknown function (DUF1929)/Bacterial Ig-like domain (group 1)